MNLRRVVAVTRETQIQQLARSVGQEIFIADDITESVDIVQTVGPDLILFDHHCTQRQIHEFLETTHKKSINIPIVVVGDDEDNTDLAKELKQTGVFDYIQGRQDYSRLEQIAGRIKEQGKVVNHNKDTYDFFIEDLAAAVSMVGKSSSIQNTIKMIKLVAASRCNPVLIVGETGTGKELSAKAMHILRCPNEPFVAVNCAALTANLLESELFGHVKGSFTGADRDKTGLLELAGTGTLLLDEISEMPMDLQAKLLRVLQEKTFRKVGGTKTLTCNATIIATSNRNLKIETQNNHFRRDLYYRLNTSPITIAPLKAIDRREDIPLLADYFLRTSTICPDKQNKITSLTRMAVEVLEKHDWPGNVRELRNVIDRAILLETTDKIGLKSIVIDPMEYEQSPNSPITSHIKDFSLAKAERELICGALRETGWQKTKAAALLGITRATLYAKVEQYNINKDSSVEKGPQTEALSPLLLQPVAAQ